MSILKKHLASYQYALHGIGLAFRNETNMRFHLIAAIAVVVTNFLLSVSKTDWLITLLLIGVVWMSEMLNTAIEKLADRVTREQDPLIRQVKDLAAGAVLIVCVCVCRHLRYGYLPTIHIYQRTSKLRMKIFSIFPL